jgi:hypothetical protein
VRSIEAHTDVGRSVAAWIEQAGNSSWWVRRPVPVAATARVRFPVEKGPRGTTQENYRAYLRNHIPPKWGTTPLGTIPALEVTAWIKDLRQRYAASTVAGS